MNMNMNNKTKKDIIEEKKGGFTCAHCKKWVSFSDSIGTHHRNHCPYCLTSQHVDNIVSGDRKSECLGSMHPIGLTRKEEGVDKYGKKKLGDVMIIVKCEKCGKISINRIAADDNNQTILDLLKFQTEPETKKELKNSQIIPLCKNDLEKIKVYLVGKIS